MAWLTPLVEVSLYWYLVFIFNFLINWTSDDPRVLPRYHHLLIKKKSNHHTATRKYKISQKTIVHVRVKDTKYQIDLLTL